MVTRRLVVLLMLGMVITIFPKAAASLTYNMILVLLDWDELDNDGLRGLWYGIGTHKLSDSDIPSLVERIALFRANQERCSDRE